MDPIIIYCAAVRRVSDFAGSRERLASRPHTLSPALSPPTRRIPAGSSPIIILALMLDRNQVVFHENIPFPFFLLSSFFVSSSFI